MTELKFQLDRTGFPMIWIDTIKAYIHWIPVTKVQFEYYLCAAPENHFDADWYDAILSLNSRVATNDIRANNYWNAFLTGIMPSEVQRFVRWCGDEFAIPTLDDWFAAYIAMKALPPEPASVIDSMGEIRGRVRMVLERLDSTSHMALKEVGYERTLADQMLMRMGVMEWVECRGRHFRWGGMGEPFPSFYGGLFTPDHGQPHIPNNPDIERLYVYGFRLIWRPV